MKKTIVLLAAAVILILAGCGANAGTAQTSSGSIKTDAKSEAPTENDDTAERYYHEPKVGAEVAAIYTGTDKQPYSLSDDREELLDTIWIYYSDNTFEQYASYGNDIMLFSIGTYKFEGDSSFLYKDGDSDHAQITITRTKKYQAGSALSDYHSEHTYDLSSIGYERRYVLEEGGKTIESVFYALNKQPYTAEDDTEDMLDTIWIYYSDNTFDQFASVDDIIVPCSTGTYQMNDGGDFLYSLDESDFGEITINRTKKYIAGKGLIDYSSSHTYELNSLGFVQIVVVKH